MTAESLALITGISLVKTIRMYTTKQLIAAWRLTLSTKLNVLYFANLKYYHLNVLGKKPSFLP